MWDNIHPAIRAESQAIAETGKFDDAIFAAFRYLEGEIQERLGSKSIGRALLDEAFDGAPPKINISDDARDREGIKDIFSGALANIRNDRGHKKSPFLPCRTIEACLLYLSYASFLLYLLSKDKNLYPIIQTLRLLGSYDQPRVELRGVNYSAEARVIASGVDARVVRVTESVLEALLPSKFSGKIQVTVHDRESNEVYCDTHSLEQKSENVYEVVSADIPLYEDAACTRLRSSVVGQLLRVTEIGREFLRIIPTFPNIYKAGNYVTHGPFSRASVDESWYRDPNSGDIEYAWTGALIATPEVLGPVETPKLVGISILPNKIQTEVNERRTLMAVGRMKEGPVRREVDVTDKVSWRALNPDITFVKDGIVFPKRLGRAKIECELEGFAASADVQVGHYPKGEKAIYFQGVRRLQQIRFDSDDNLYFCNQSASVYQLARTGGVKEVVRISQPDTYPVGVDCIAVDSNRNLYVNDMYRSNCLRFFFDGQRYVNPQVFATSVKGTKKSIAVDNQGNIFVAVMSGIHQGHVIHIAPDGKEAAFSTRDSAIYLALDPQGNICIPSARERAVHVYSNTGEFLDSFVHGMAFTPCDILVDSNGAIFLPVWETGKILKINPNKPILKVEVVAEVLLHSGGIAMDSSGHIYVSNFNGNAVEMIY